MRLTNFNDITRKYRQIFLSPHLDDVVYSCGGTLGVQVSCGINPLVITVFSGAPAPTMRLSPFATQSHRKMDSATLSAREVVEARRKEEAAALDYLQVDYLWLDYADAIYRGDPAHYTEEEQLIGGDVHPGDLWIDKQLAQDLLTLQERLPDAVWYSPLGLGRHVDHQIVCSAADRLVQRGARVNFYEDFPYVLKDGMLDDRLKEMGTPLEPVLVEMSEMLPMRIEAASMYASQTRMNFSSEEVLQTTMQSYTHSIRPVETVHLERYWTGR